LSGSVGAITPTPSTFYAGTLTLTNSTSPTYVCTSPITFDVYTVTGELTQYETIYYDRYGVSPVTGFYYYTTAYTGGEIVELNPANGQIGYGSGFFC
jgi:hypothetical protein